MKKNKIFATIYLPVFYFRENRYRVRVFMPTIGSMSAQINSGPNQIMITLTELETPESLPAGERHMHINGVASLPDALQKLQDDHNINSVKLDRVYHTKSDGRYWFVLMPRKKEQDGQRHIEEETAPSH